MKKLTALFSVLTLALCTMASRSDDDDLFDKTTWQLTGFGDFAADTFDEVNTSLL